LGALNRLDVIDCRTRTASQTGKCLEVNNPKGSRPWEGNDVARQVELIRKPLLAFDAIGDFDGSYPFAWARKAFHVNLLLISSLFINPLPTSCHDEICTRPSARHTRKMFPARSSRWPIEERTKIRMNTSTPSLLHRWNHATYENIRLSHSTASRTGTCSPVKPTRSRAPMRWD
jgi:hypothetical protein